MIFAFHCNGQEPVGKQQPPGPRVSGGTWSVRKDKAQSPTFGDGGKETQRKAPPRLWAGGRAIFFLFQS